MKSFHSLLQKLVGTSRFGELSERQQVDRLIDTHLFDFDSEQTMTSALQTRQ